MKRTPIAAAILATLAAASHAQEAAPVPATAASSPANALPPVIVTGEKTTRSLDKTAPSVKVWTEGDLAANPGLLSQRALLEGTVNITSSGTQNLAPAVRGIDGTGPSQGGDAFLAGTRSRLNVVVDGRPASYNEITFGDLGLWDVNRVEIFRGAQSTLQGRNAIAGTVLYTTNEPSFTPEYGARMMMGRFGTQQVSVLASGPIVDDALAFRLTADYAANDSYVTDYRPYPGVEDPGHFESKSVRGKLLVKPQGLPGFRTTVTLARTEFMGPQTEGVSRPFEARRNGYPSMPVFEPHVDSGTVETSWDLRDGWSLENSLVAGRFLVKRYAVAGDGNAVIDGRDWSLEPRVRYANADGTLTALVGAFGFRSRQSESIDLFDGGNWDDRVDTKALYGETTVAVSPVLDLTVGGRYERERHTRVGGLRTSFGFNFDSNVDQSHGVFLPKAVLAWKSSPLTTLGLGLSRGYNGGNAGVTTEVDDNGNYQTFTYDPEYVWNLEGFLRSRQLDGRLQLVANVFYSRYKDLQTPFDTNSDPAIWAYIVRNAPRAETYGTEFDATWLAMPGLKLKAGLGLLRARITRYPDSGVEGHELPRSPRVSATLGAHWTHASGFELGGNARYSSAYYSDITNVQRGRVEPGWTANLTAGYGTSKARVFAFVNNLFDTQRPILLDADPSTASQADDVAMLPRPRTFGVGLEIFF